MGGGGDVIAVALITSNINIVNCFMWYLSFLLTHSLSYLVASLHSYFTVRGRPAAKSSGMATPPGIAKRNQLKMVQHIYVFSWLGRGFMAWTDR